MALLQLRKIGYTADLVTDGRQAVDAYRKINYQLVLMDCQMPVMDGYEAMTAIRAQERFAKLPIIALTAKAMPEDRRKCIDAGANDYLGKPVDVEQLLAIIRVWLGRAH